MPSFLSSVRNLSRSTGRGSLLDRLERAVGAFVLLLLFGSGGAFAASFTVDTTTDSVDASLGNGLCADSLGRCSLRAAIMEARRCLKHFLKTRQKQLNQEDSIRHLVRAQRCCSST
jgi:CSLREA domain-containing protein